MDNLLVCESCGSENVWMLAWVNANSNDFVEEVSDLNFAQREWCGDCDGFTTLIPAEDFVSEDEDEDDE